MSQMEAMVAVVFTKAMKGDLASIKFISQTLGIDETDIQDAKLSSINEDSLDVLKTHADWIGLLETARSELTNTGGELENIENDDNAF